MILPAVLALFVGVRAVTSTIIAKSTLNECFQSDAGLTGCSNKLVVALTVENGENATSSIELKFFSATVNGQDQQIANKDISIVIRKTPVYFYYPTTYLKTVNYQPWEQVAYGTISGSDFTPYNDNILFGEINTCLDGDEDDTPSCGWAYDADGNRIVSSQGKCCKCSFFQLLGLDDVYMTRSNLQCGLDSAYTQSSHCLRYDPLWYHIYTIGTPTTYYSIQVETHYCDKSGSNCNITSIELSPNHRSDKSDDDLVFAKLEGDFEMFEPAPTFDAEYLAVPSGLTADDCNGLQDPGRDFSLTTRCLDHINAGPDYYMFVPQTMFGEECNKIGVTYPNFRFQSEFCTQEFESCTDHQLADLFEADQDAANAGATGLYWAKNQGSLGLSQLTVEDSTGANIIATMQQTVQDGTNDASLIFQTDRYQASLLTLELAADDITYIVCLGTADITSVSLPDFESNSNSGLMEVTLTNPSSASVGDSGYCNAAFLVEVTACSTGIVPATEASSVDLAPGDSTTVNINVKYEATIGLENFHHNCTVLVYDAYANQVASQQIDFETTATITEKPQGNDCSDTNSCGNAAAQGLISPCSCQWYEFSCVWEDWDDCSSSFWNVIIVVGCALAVLVCCCIGCCVLGPKGCAKCIFLPCRLMQRCCCPPNDSDQDDNTNNDGNTGRRSQKYHHNDDSHSSGDIAMAELAKRPAATPKSEATSSLVDNKVASPIHVITGARRAAVRLCGSVYFNVSTGADQDFPALLQPGPQFSIRGILTQHGPQSDEFEFQVSADHAIQTQYYDGSSFQVMQPARAFTDEQMNMLGGTMTSRDVIRFVTQEARFTVLNKSIQDSL